MIAIGTSGWHYGHWKGSFYPEDLPPARFLEHYAQHFQSVEVNSSFYQLPKRETLRAWHDAVPEGFTFAVKASRYITHMKKLKDPQAPLANLYGPLEALGEKLGPILFQLPPSWRFNPERLKAFLKALSPAHRHVFEFRDPSWFDERAYAMLARHGAAFCIYELAGTMSPQKRTAGFAYVRLHGPGAAYQGSYDEQTLGGWAETLARWAEEGQHDVFCFFDNDEAGYAPRNAATLQAMLR